MKISKICSTVFGHWHIGLPWIMCAKFRENQKNCNTAIWKFQTNRHHSPRPIL